MATDCLKCSHLHIFEDQSEDMRRPFACCSLDLEIVEVDIYDWESLAEKCPQFTLGEPEIV